MASSNYIEFGPTRSELMVAYVRNKFFIDENGHLSPRDFNRRAGRPCKSADVHGKGKVELRGVCYSLLTLAWIHAYGEIPARRVVSIDGNKFNCRADNLTLALPSDDLTAEYVRRNFRYCVSSGVLFKTRHDDSPLEAERPVGSATATRHLQVRVKNKGYLVHRLVWLYVYGKWPDGVIDHINGDPHDNRIENLRDVDQRTNAQNIRKAPKHNAHSRLLGASLSRRKTQPDKWASYITDPVRNTTVCIGSFGSAEEAHQAYLEAKRRLHPGCTI